MARGAAAGKRAALGIICPRNADTVGVEVVHVGTAVGRKSDRSGHRAEVRIGGDGGNRVGCYWGSAGRGGHGGWMALACE